MTSTYLKTLVALLQLLWTPGHCEEYNSTSHEDEPGYGTEWMYFPDGDGVPTYVNLTEEPPQDMNREMGDLEMYVHFLYYSRNNPDKYIELFFDDETSKSSESNSEYPFGEESFDTKKQLRVVTHGWLSSGNSSTVQNIKDAYLRKEDVNVVIVDWEKLASSKTYFIPAVWNTRVVGRRTAEMLDYLISNYDVNGRQMHLSGHSLGAHVMGYAGMYTKNDNISRITGMDPAKPGFEHYFVGKDSRLDDTDADFVDVIHTCAGVLGYKAPLGHADFYPNKGTPAQPGCGGMYQIVEACSHGRSHEYFAESIENNRFAAYPCDSWDEFEDGKCSVSTARMGEAAGDAEPGIYYLHTNEDSPYARGNEFDDSND